jgi:diacylglycerol kinase family enzyme
MKALLVHNPKAGTEGHDKEAIIDALRLGDFKVDYISTKDNGLKAALNDASGIVVVAGGDGTVARVFSHLTNRAIPVGILPLGSANNIARSLGISGTPAELTEHWREGHVKPFKLIAVKSQEGTALCAEGFGIGMMAALIKRRAKGKKSAGADDLSRGRHALAEILSEAATIDAEITVDGTLWESELLSIDVLNVPFTGPALPLAYKADPGAGELKVVGVKPDKAKALAEWVQHPQEEKPPVANRSGTTIEVRWRDCASRIDDEVFKRKDEWQMVTLSCDRQPLRILATTEHPAVKKSTKAGKKVHLAENEA